MSASDKLYTAVFVTVVEERWFNKVQGGPYVPELERTPERVERSYGLAAHLYFAADAASAYAMASSWISGFQDANHDGPGDLIVTYSLGLHDIEEMPVTSAGLVAAIGEPYGLEVANIDCAELAPGRPPRVRQKDELSIFRALRR